jgi:copper chaperone CopZ
MKLPLFALVLTLLLGPAIIQAAEVTYAASLHGIECQACKKSVAQALGKLPGVQTVRISPGSRETHSVTVLTDGSAALTLDQAVRALGKKAPHYKIVSWSRR